MIQSNKLLFAIDGFLERFVALAFALLERVLPQSAKQGLHSLKLHKTALHNALGLTFFNALGGALVLITQVKLANVMGAAVYGLYSYYWAIGMVGTMFVRYGREKTMTRDLIQFPEKEGFLIPNTFLLGCCNLLIFLLIVILFHNQLDADLSWAYVLLIVSPCLMSLDFQPVYEAHRLMSWHSIYYLIQKFIFLLFIWLIIAFTSSISLTTVGVIIFSSWILVLSLQYREVIIGLGIRIFASFSFSNLFHLYRSNFLIALSCLFGVAYGPFIRFVLNQYADSRAVGVYSAGFQIFLMAQFILQQIGRVGNPMMASVGRVDCPSNKRRLFIRRYLAVMVACALPFAALLFLFPDWIAETFFTREYAGLAETLPLFGCYLIALSVGVVYAQFLISMRKDRVYFTIFVCAAISAIPIGLFLIPRYGVLGAALTLCLPDGIGNICYCIYSQYYLRVNKQTA